MFAYIKGKLASSTPAHVIIEASGIGYKILIPANVFPQLKQIGTDIHLHLSFVVREQAQTLYGFITHQERDFFEELLNVTGIGPKIAMALIGHMPLDELHRAIAVGDAPTITRVPGIGKKGAERLIIEMRDKLGSFTAHATDYAIQLKKDPRAQSINDATSALISLGYNQATAQKAIQKTLKNHPEMDDLAQMISISLKNV